jgi:hypothetical protein
LVVSGPEVVVFAAVPVFFTGAFVVDVLGVVPDCAG